MRVYLVDQTSHACRTFLSWLYVWLMIIFVGELCSVAGLTCTCFESTIFVIVSLTHFALHSLISFLLNWWLPVIIYDDNRNV